MKSKNKITLLIVVILLQSLINNISNLWTMALSHGFSNFSTKNLTLISSVLGVILTVLSVYLVQEIIHLVRAEQKAETLLIESKEMLDVLRTHRHDFKNQLQVIYGAIQLEKLDYALNYIKTIDEELIVGTAITNLKQFELASLIYKKMHYAEHNALKFIASIESDFANLKISPIDLCRIAGNLIDNALFAVEQLSAEDRVVEITTDEDENFYILEVFNKNPVISQEIQCKIFEQGFTTKGIQGSGLGLHIVKSLTEKYNGEIKLVSDEENGTLFTIKFPKEKTISYAKFKAS